MCSNTFSSTQLPLTKRSLDEKFAYMKSVKNKCVKLALIFIILSWKKIELMQYHSLSSTAG